MDLIGKTLDGLYQVQEMIGTGGMANVYKAVAVAPGGPVPQGTVVAVKVLRSELMHDPDLVRRFQNESKAISLLNHPNIVKVYDVSVTDQLQYIVMEYVDGMTLRQYLNQRGGKLTSRETVHFISQILKALEHAHRNGIVHRDIKPQNIMLLDNGQLRMMDFGIARISRAENQLNGGKAMGSVHYISPEQAKGEETDCTSDLYSVGVMMYETRISRAENQLNGGKAMGSVHYISPEQAKGEETDCTSDLYSVGVMMYEMLSGQLPFDAKDAVDVALQQISEKPRSLREIAPQTPLGLVEITERAMAKNPVNRYANAGEMLDALDRYVHDPSITFHYVYQPEQAPAKEVQKPMEQKRDRRQPDTSSARRQKKPAKKRRSVFLPVLLGITVAFALACGAMCWSILQDSSNLMNEKTDVTLGDYLGMTRDEVNAQPQVTSGQILIQWEEEYNNDYAAGYVYRQSPVSGRTVREGQTITLTVSLGTKYITVPDLANYLQTDAERLLREQGVSVLVTQAVEPSVATGSVIRTEPAAGSQVAAGTTVIVYVSRPQVNTSTRVPALEGMDVNDARTLLVQNRLGLGSQTEQYSDTPPGTVLSQSPEAGASVKLNSRINVVVSAGPEPAPEPEVPTTPEDWWSGLFGGGASSSPAESESEQPSSTPSLSDWWASLVG